MPRNVFHWIDTEPANWRQAAVTTICGMRVKRHQTIASQQYVSCVGCRAILLERAKEKILQGFEDAAKVMIHGK